MPHYLLTSMANNTQNTGEQKGKRLMPTENGKYATYLKVKEKVEK